MSDDPLIFIGRTKWRDLDRPFGLRRGDRRAHMYVIGKTGTGKSSLLEAMIRQDILSGNGVSVFDPHGDLVERLHEWMPAGAAAGPHLPERPRSGSALRVQPAAGRAAAPPFARG